VSSPLYLSGDGWLQRVEEVGELLDVARFFQLLAHRDNLKIVKSIKGTAKVRKRSSRTGLAKQEDRD